MTSRHRRRTAPSVIAVILMALTIAACGSSSSSSGSSSASSSSASSSGASSSSISGSGRSSGVDPAAVADVNAHTKAPTSIGPTQPVGKPIPTGKKIAIVNCGPEGCTRAVNAFKAAAQVLGWSVTELTPSQPTPQLIQAQFDQAVSLHPDAVVSTALPVVAFQRQAAELKAMHIPLVSLYGTDPTGGDIGLQIFGVDGDDALAKIAADKTVVDLGGKGTIGTVVLSGYVIIADYVAAYTAEVKKVCPKCNIKSITIQPTSLGSTDGTDIVNFLRANPDVNALLLGYEQVGDAGAQRIGDALDDADADVRRDAALDLREGWARDAGTLGELRLREPRDRALDDDVDTEGLHRGARLESVHVSPLRRSVVAARGGRGE